ncbi:MAG: outer membrane lipoprotein-sorting protein [Bdellovibrionota bacterium]
MKANFETTPFGFLAAALAACALVTYSFSSDAFAVSDVEGAKLLEKADDIRNPSKAYTMRIVVKSDESEQEFEVMLKGTDKTMIVTKAPARDLGRNMLMLDRDFYAYIPNLKRSMRLSLAQKMSGQVANGDIARTRWAGDYTVKVEKSDGKETQLLLDGNKKNLTYQKIRLWVETSSAKPLRAEYLSLDGKTLLKKAVFEDYKALAGAQRPGRLRITDTGGKESTITIRNMVARDLGDAIFSTTNLEKAR